MGTDDSVEDNPRAPLSSAHPVTADPFLFDSVMKMLSEFMKNTCFNFSLRQLARSIEKGHVLLNQQCVQIPLVTPNANIFPLLGDKDLGWESFLRPVCEQERTLYYGTVCKLHNVGSS